MLKKYILILMALTVSISLSAQSKKAIKLVEKAKEHMRKGTLVEATVHLTNAIEKYENYAEAYELRGMSFQNMDRLEQAKKDYKRAVKIEPGRIISCVRLLGLYKESEEWEEVKRYAKIIQENNPANACPAMFELAHGHDKLGEAADALDAYTYFLGKDCEGMDEQRELAKKRIKELK